MVPDPAVETSKQSLSEASCSVKGDEVRRLRSLHTAYDSLTNDVRRQLLERGLPNPSLKVVTKACELFQEFATLYVNSDAMSRWSRSNHCSVALHSFGLPTGMVGVEVPACPHTTIVTKKWELDYSLLLSICFMEGWNENEPSALATRVHSVFAGFWAQNVPAVKIHQGSQTTAMLSDLSVTPRFSSGPRLEISLADYERYLRATQRDIERRVALAQRDQTLITRFDTIQSHDPYEFFQCGWWGNFHKNPDGLKALARACVLAELVDYFRMHPDGTLKQLLNYTHEQHQQKGFQLFQDLQSLEPHTPCAAASELVDRHIFHHMSAIALACYDGWVIRSLEGFSTR